jgi:uncharacterized surface protein with fasciclin (FAS1) repeats
MRVSRTLTGVGLAAALALGLVAWGDDDDATSEGIARTGESDPAEGGQTSGTIVDVASGNDDFSTLVDAVTAADLGATLSASGPFTVFAPVNEAFEKLPSGTLDSLLLAQNKDQLRAILAYHVVPAAVMSSELTDGQVVKTVQGASLTVGIDGGTVTLTDQAGSTATVTAADVEASNGVIHVIDSVLLPTG